VADLSAYLTPEEFAKLGSTAHHAVWRAAAEKRVDSRPWSASYPTGVRVYRRDQVLALLDEAGVHCG
jgi:hypothetical protein